MEEWVGQHWHRFISRVADRRHADAAVTLPEVQRTITLMFRAGGGAPGLRFASATATRAGGPRGWLQRVAGSGTHAATARLDAEALSLPPEVAVFADAALNRRLYLWLAALAAHYTPTGDWLADNLHATAAALVQFPGMHDTHAALVAAQLALRPAPATLRGVAAAAERTVQQALRGEPVTLPAGLKPADAAPVWLWLDAAEAAAATARQDPADTGANEASRAKPTTSDRRRHAERVQDERGTAPLMMFFRAESILSWGEFVRVDRASDDDDDGNALAAADDMDTLAIAPDGSRAASRVRFDLDLPSAAADDRPLGPGLRLPEWDWRQQTLIPEHCAAQVLVAAAPPPWQPPPALRAVARRVRRRMEVLRAAPLRARAQADGDELDLDAWLRHRVLADAGRVDEQPAVWQRRVRGERSLATLLLADLSLSTDAWAGGDARIVDVIRDAMWVFGEALAAGGDAFEMLGFSSVRRQNVRIQHLKGFDEPWNGDVRARLGAIKPGYYTRMGAALRLATQRLAARPERQRLLLILTDGKPNDLDVYEGRYGLEDTRHAVQAARDAGLQPFCVTIDESAHDYLPMLFGQHGWALVHRPQDLVQRLATVYARMTRG
ncbi:nitric oxide reductase activation protein NorD [Rubrivivax benzoatilyticus]|uniref:VWA domain-containing protein n=1 Tax=Rubrivivax benzoatilyticus TaxID=316997 RepID=A0ABX0HTU6_9BURK|nr:VWA domain-containing protein [Rubrivivax benzoatilyticus]EGJ11063.1 von Willebrand factor type A [Rubrivivax benzoatilyticus JA2 = ATCC BAA-35]NHK96928.1 VWA domain-containing protein [Rubrivivax benzoatilyticus]NHL24643.1 VWA domain-containing protein [Rubrivivax benzoatilyticus]